MLSEKQKVNEEFHKLFSEISERQIAVYGMGQNARVILENIEGYSFRCVISDRKEVGSFCGFPVFDIFGAMEVSDLIIIAAIPTSTCSIYERIKDIITPGIDVYDMRGHKLNSDEDAICYLKRSAKTLWDKEYVDRFIKNNGDKVKNKIIMDDYELVAWIITPITILYLSYIFECAKEYDFLLFASRDGYFLHYLYKKYMNSQRRLAKGVYFYTSRTSISSAAARDSEDIKTLCNKLYEDSRIDIRQFFDTQFHVTVSTDFDIGNHEEKSQRLEAIQKGIDEYTSEILRKSKTLRNNYLKYFSTLNLHGEIAVVDIVTQGTTVYGASNLLGREIDLIAMGTTSVPNKFIKNSESVHSLFGNINKTVNGVPYSFSDFSELHLFLEMLYASDEGQLYEFTSKAQPIFINGSKYNSGLLRSVQREIDKIVSGLSLDFCRTEFSEDFCLAMMRMFYHKFSVFSDGLKKEFDFNDPYDPGMYKCNLLETLGW